MYCIVNICLLSNMNHVETSVLDGEMVPLKSASNAVE